MMNLFDLHIYIIFFNYLKNLISGVSVTCPLLLFIMCNSSYTGDSVGFSFECSSRCSVIVGNCSINKAGLTDVQFKKHKEKRLITAPFLCEILE